MITITGLVSSYALRVVAYFLALKRGGWYVIDSFSLFTIALVSLILGVLFPAGAFDIVGIIVRTLIISVFVVVLMGDSIGDAVGVTVTAAVVEVILGFFLSMMIPWAGINPFAIP